MLRRLYNAPAPPERGLPTHAPALALLGCGRFGRLVATELSRLGPIHVWERAWDGAAPPTDLGSNVLACPFEVAAKARVVLLAVPIRALPETLDRLAPHTGPGTLVVDTASVKSWPMKWMEERLPPHVDFEGTHPLFGPDSATGSLRGHTIVWVRGRSRRPRPIRRFLERLGLRVVERTADEHDREMAETQALVHWLGRALSSRGIRTRELETLGFRQLREISGHVTRDTTELFEDLERWNPHAASVRAEFLAALHTLHARLGGGEGRG